MTDTAGLNSALAGASPGDVIRLAPGTYSKVTISGRNFTGAGVKIAGTGSVVLSGLSVTGSSGLTFENLTITPSDRSASTVPINSSSTIAFDQVHFVGTNEATGVSLDIARESQGIRIVRSEFTLCRSGRPCLQPGGRDITVSNTRFHDCFDCDMVRGGGNGVTFDGDTFERALRGTGSNHNDLIQIMGGGPWTITRNTFGDHKGGAAQVFVSPNTKNESNPIHDVTIESNIFVGESGFAMFIAGGAKSTVGLPKNVRIVNNTVLSGKTNAIRIGPPFLKADPALRPLVANNILGISTTTICAGIRASHNLVIKGQNCPGDVVGSANLDTTNAPTALSTLIIDRADPASAPPTDFFGHARRGLPDIGAIEFGGISTLPLQLRAPARLTLSLKTLRARSWKVTVTVGLGGADQLRSRLLRGTRVLASSTRTVTGKTRVVVSLLVPATARRAGAMKVTLRATTKDGKSLTKTVLVSVRR